MSTTVVIPARNAAETIARQVEALSRQRGDDCFHVIVVDNGSSDGTGAVALANAGDRFTIEVVHESRPGINMARNAGIARAPDGLILLCDADDEVSDGWVRAMVSARVPQHWLAGMVDYSTLNSAKTMRQWAAPARSVPPENDLVGDRTFGCNCGFDRKMWVEIGGFDGRLSGVGGDETEMFLRALAAGYRPRWVPDGLVAYRLRPGLPNMCRQRFRQGRNQVRMRRLLGEQTGSTVPIGRDEWLALGKLAIAMPFYLGSSRRFEWLAACSRNVGRLVGINRDAPCDGQQVLT